MTDKIEVTPEEVYAFLDRCAAHASDRAIDDMAAELSAFAHAARIEGARAALEAAATELECREDEMDPNSECCGIYAVSSYAIRALDPEQIVKGMSQ